MSTDEHAYPDEHTTPELLVTLRDGATIGQDGHTYLLLAEIPEVVQKLTELYWRLTVCSAPVVKRAVA